HNKQADDGWLQAWDPVSRSVVWETERGARATSGVLATAGNLVFMGNSNGNELAAYNAETGEVLWNFDTQSAVYAAPITYELDGEQYIAASVGGTGGSDYYAPSYGRMLVFKIGGEEVLPAKLSYTPPALNPPLLTATADVVAHGGEVYSEHCAVCHGNGAVQQRSSFPNLTLSPLLHSQAGFDQVVLNGARLARGMAAYSDRLTAEDSLAVREYIVSRAIEVMNAPPRPAFGPPPSPEPDDVHEEAADN
ncbi:MAG TPA: PQQ-binding-like beta-propeller repeat protein, partial [Pseudomonadaceae bacterium]|nr:PQQ-binding-like beta-propeller repeat protein [Pseudomonadaceae bacterium]